MKTEERRANMLTDNDVQSIANALRGHTQSSSEKMSDNITKIGVALCTAGIFWITASLAEMKEQQIRMDEWRNISIEQMKETKAFMSIPRFSAQTFETSFAAKIQPLSTEVRDNTKAVIRLLDLHEEVRKQRSDIEVIKNKLDIDMNE